MAITVTPISRLPGQTAQVCMTVDGGTASALAAMLNIANVPWPSAQTATQMADAAGQYAKAIVNTMNSGNKNIIEVSVDTGKRASAFVVATVAPYGDTRLILDWPTTAWSVAMSRPELDAALRADVGNVISKLANELAAAYP